MRVYYNLFITYRVIITIHFKNLLKAINGVIPCIENINGPRHEEIGLNDKIFDCHFFAFSGRVGKIMVKTVC